MGSFFIDIWEVNINLLAFWISCVFLDSNPSPLPI